MNRGLKFLTFAAAFAAMSPALSSAQGTAPYRDSCVVQVTKNTTTSDRAHFVMACGSETLAVHDVRPFSEMTEAEVIETKAVFTQAVKNLVGEDSTCNQWDSELFFIAICTK